MIISLNPLYGCNFRCEFCYLTPTQLSDLSTIDLDTLDKMLSDISSNTTIDHVDLYGGEIGILPPKYYYDMKSVIRRHYSKPINIITNLSRVSSFFLDDDITLSVSWDYTCRERHEQVYRNMLKVEKDIHVLMLAGKCLIEKDVDEIITMLNFVSNVKSVEVKPYSTNQSNQHSVSHRDFEEFMKRWIDSPVMKKFDFTNEQKILSSLDKSYNAWSNDHLYITPSGKFAVLEFDSNDNEFFLHLDNYDDYLVWADKEKSKVKSNDFCKKCEFLGHCLTEHYREVQSLEHSCNGYKYLLEWYRLRE
jgi:sulfatase maturation enzyme AslB (radical SAM superfamily)